MIENLNILYDEGILMERPRDRDKKYELVKGDIYVIDPEIVSVKVGLGWDATGCCGWCPLCCCCCCCGCGSIDVDASVIILNEKVVPEVFLT